MLTRREFIRTAALFALAPHVFAEREKEIWVNDVHSQLNRIRVRELLTPRTRDELAEIVRSASRKGLPLSVGMSAFDGRPAIRHRQHLHRYAFTRSRNLFRSGAWFGRSGSGHPMAQIDSHLSGRPGE